MERICRLAKEMGYRPSLAARSLSKGGAGPASRLLGATIFVPFNQTAGGLTDPLFFDYFCGMTGRLGDGGHRMELVRFKNSSQEFEVVHDLVKNRQIGGIVDFNLMAGTLKFLYQNGLPVVSSNWKNPKFDFPVVVADHVAGYREAWRYVIEGGHQRVAFFSVSNASLNRYHQECHVAAVLEGAADRLQWLVVADDLDSDETIWAALSAALGEYETSHWPTFFFAQNDFVACQLMRTLQRHGIRVPEQVSVLGFDDSVSARCSTPLLSTIQKPRVEIGHGMIDLLVDMIRGENLRRGFSRAFPTRMILRESTGRAPQQGAARTLRRRPTSVTPVKD